jgi:parallel beta-helix repeat protein
VPSNAGYVALVNCTNITVQNLSLANNNHGVLLVATGDSLITGNYLGNNFFGIVFHGSSDHCFNNVVSKNNITENAKDGIYSWGSHNTSITGNSITDNQEKGVSFYESPNAYIVGNAITDSIDLRHSTNSTVRQNNIEIPEHEIPDAIPEFPSWTPLLIMLVAVLVVASIYRRNLYKRNQRKLIK